MTQDRAAEIRRIVCQEALDRPPSERSRYLSEVCAGDEALRQEIEALLERSVSADKFLSAPAIEIVARGMADAARDARRVLIGARLGAYEIVSLIGIGGMGEVYRARDTKLGREVAIKILPIRPIAETNRTCARRSRRHRGTLGDAGRRAAGSRACRIDEESPHRSTAGKLH